MALLANFSIDFFMKFSQKMPLYLFYTIVQKSQDDQKLKSRGPALTLYRPASQKSVAGDR